MLKNFLKLFSNFNLLLKFYKEFAFTFQYCFKTLVNFFQNILQTQTKLKKFLNYVLWIFQKHFSKSLFKLKQFIMIFNQLLNYIRK